MEHARYTKVEKVSAIEYTASSRTHADDLQGKGKAQETQDQPQTPTSRRPSSSIRTEPLPSSPTSPVQGARLAMNRRLPVRPTPSSPRLLPAFKPEPIPKQQVINPRASSHPITESMTKEFKYNPDDKTPPKRRMKAVAEAVTAIMEGDPGPSSTSPSKREPVTQGVVPTAKLDVNQQEAQQKLEQARAQAGLGKAEALRSEEPPASYALDVTAKLTDMEAILTTNRVILETADNSTDPVSGRNTLARRNLLRTDESILGDDSSDEDDGPAAYFLKSDAQRHFEENKRLTVLSEHTEPSSSGRGDDVGGLSAGFRIEQPNLTSLNIVEPGVWMGQSNV